MGSRHKMNVYYISIEGNTKHFVNKMAKTFHNIKLYQVSDQSDFIAFKRPFFVFVPTYVKGTQEDTKHPEKQPGENFGIQEISTLTMRDELKYKKNYKNCLGIIGSGNRNFGEDCYCWTALQYHRLFKVPVIDNYEIRGTMEDENRINKKMTKIWNKVNPTNKVKYRAVHKKSALLKRLEEQNN